MQITLNLPDDLVSRAQDAGLLTTDAMQKLLEEAVRRQAGRKLLSIAERLHAANIPPMSEDALNDLVHEVRAERRARNAGSA
jgi:hypothetical protein